MVDSGPISCKNCGERAEGSFCKVCGQRTSIGRVTFKETFHDFTNILFSIGAPLPVTLGKLISNPGFLFREYLAGKRKKYYKPISFFVLFTLTYLFIKWVIQFEDYMEVAVVSNLPRIDLELFSRAREYMFENIKSMALILVFTMAIFLKLFFRKQYTLAEYVAISFYLNGFYSLLATLNLVFIKYANPAVQYLALMVMCAYFVYAIVSFFQKQKLKVVLKSFLAFSMAYAGYLFLALNISYFIVMIKQV
ncbi:DUF3667 domain-containing protein [Flagellimonas meridianipacifica]|uniref:Uncharacterized protein DUF3667 n=1 Tax=Flagellimonas meridianipacifica TaxID=1080225 RepID=A0A2T0MJ18_9FLAO|nr:DUF3667 domain-containing protein [Allomuricauda pacifica]PRX57553.1 uncharacterized protein DUF3667 [Allomuricauda pacifica]